jgi:peptidylprolyl isomerase
MKSVFLAGLVALTPSVCTAQQAPVPQQATDVVKTASGLTYVDLKVGEGDSPKVGQTAIVHYTGWLQQNDQKFDSSVDRKEPFKFHLGKGEVIPAWDEGVATMKIGGKRQLIVPASLAYGANGVPGAIPPNATLVFVVELLGVED